MDQQVFDGDPFVRSISLPEEDTFSGQLMPWPDFDFDDGLYELSKPAANENYSGDRDSSSQKKLNHNAYERDRRTHLNEHYSSLHLPDADQTKKSSIATTVSQVLKYIPELQKQVENLERRKKKLMNADCKRGVQNPSGSMAPIVSVNCLNEIEVMVQISF